MTWKMSSASPGAVPVRASDRQQFEYRIDSGRGRARIEPMCSVVTGDGRCENVQLAADENEEWAKVRISRRRVAKMLLRHNPATATYCAMCNG